MFLKHFLWQFLIIIAELENRGGLNALIDDPTIRSLFTINIICVFETIFDKKFHRFSLPFANSTAHLNLVTNLDALSSDTRCCFCPFLEKYGDSDRKPIENQIKRISETPI